MPQKKATYGTQVTAEARNGKAYIRLVDTISEYGTASAADVRMQIDTFLRDGVTEAQVYINSRGGNCFESAEIANELERLDSVDIRVGSLAASAATYLLTRFPSKAKPNSQFMLHRPKLSTYGDIVSITADLRLLENTTADYKAAYARKMGISEEEVETLWSVGDVWLTAQEALEKGLIDEIEHGTDQPVTAEDVAILEACGAPVIPNETDNLNNRKVERTEIIAALGLSADATDEQILQAMKAAKKKADEAQASEQTAEQALAAKVEALVKKANLVDKKITAEQVPHFTKMATADYESTAAILASLPAIPSLSAQLRQPISQEDQAERKNWTLDDYLEKDPSAYQHLIANDPEKAKRLEAAYFGTK